MGIAAVSFKDKNGIEFVIYPQGEWDTIDFDAATLEEDMDMIAYEEKEAASKAVLSKLDIATSVDRQKILRLRETVPAHRLPSGVLPHPSVQMFPPTHSSHSAQLQWLTYRIRNNQYG